MKILDILTERVSNNYLYHAMDSRSAGSAQVLGKVRDIAHGGDLGAYTTNSVDGKDIHGTSFSRSRDMSMRSPFGNIVFVVDKNKLTMNNKLIPLDDLDGGHDKKRSEVEEFVVGNVKNFAKCIVAVHVNWRRDGPKGEIDFKEWEMTLSELTRNYPHIKVIDQSRSEGLDNARNDRGRARLGAEAKAKENEGVISQTKIVNDLLDTLTSTVQKIEHKLDAGGFSPEQTETIRNNTLGNAKKVIADNRAKIDAGPSLDDLLAMAASVEGSIGILTTMFLS